MCLIVFAYRQHSQYPLILLANRDEFYARPTRPVHFWEEAPEVFAGRDLVHGGTWLGITGSGRFAALTNFRQPGGPRGTISRGELVSRFLKADQTVPAYLESVRDQAEDYSGFNLLAGQFSDNGFELGYFSNRGDDRIKMLESGIYGLSNHLLNTPWPKVERAKNGLSKIISKNPDLNPDNLFNLLADRTPAPEEDLPDTGVGPELEKLLSPIFIETPIYGTRCSSLVVFEKELNLDERVFH